MSTSSDTRWYDLGHALERARRYPTRERLDDLVERLMSFGPNTDSKSTTGFDLLIDGGASVVAGKLLGALPSQERPSVGRVVQGAALGAAATLVRELAAPLLQGRLEAPALDEGLTERLISGASRGAIYAGVIDPLVPGPPALRGALFATVEYLLAPRGGLSTVAGKIAPWRRIPGAHALLKESKAGELTLVDHLVFGLALAMMLGEG